MADFGAPSFSLGFDFSMDPDSLVNPSEQPPLHVPVQPSTSFCSPIDDEIDFGTLATDVGSDVRDSPPPLKRLRRGFASERVSTAKNESFEFGSILDDDIEEFSSQEDTPAAKRPLSQHNSVCSGSKSHLHGGSIFRRVAPQHTQKKMKQSLDTPVSSLTDNTSTKTQFPKLTISPLRRFQLISDSDSDSDSDDTTNSDECKRKDDISLKSVNDKKTAKSFGITSQKEDLWKDFELEKSFAIPTPVLDEVCEEYFRSVKDNTGTNNLRGYNRTKENRGSYGNPYSVDDDESNGSLLDQAPPSHQYFFNDDPRICSLVRSRLPNFFPLELDNITSRGNTQPGSSVIDYMSQFNQGESSKGRGGVKANNQSTNSTKNKKNSKKVTAEETQENSRSWINPRSTNKVAPENAAKRRVQAVGQSADQSAGQSPGYWYTGSSGRRVYVKDGKELTGKIAYGQYKKDNGTGFKSSKNKKSGGSSTKAGPKARSGGSSKSGPNVRPGKKPAVKKEKAASRRK
ncbi:uncharacterized protein LOC124921100 [Impatiens glandulifera]|uniref:uncharacterized protein LOC124921100 n=1 Tax=Impatiens glandulifera TaxID=253017 RepID=UPI001FB11CAC|nr:uncharacterized protein LOC124921100 [Impatiens glandulifera]